METLRGRHDYEEGRMHGTCVMGSGLMVAAATVGRNCGVPANVKHRVQCLTQQSPTVVCFTGQTRMQQCFPYRSHGGHDLEVHQLCNG